MKFERYSRILIYTAMLQIPCFYFYNVRGIDNVFVFILLMLFIDRFIVKGEAG